MDQEVEGLLKLHYNITDPYGRHCSNWNNKKWKENLEPIIENIYFYCVK